MAALRLLFLACLLVSTSVATTDTTSPTSTTPITVTNTTAVPTTTTAAPPSDVCKICKNMVAAARETLASNETMDEMKQVFEGTCRILLPVKALGNLCVKYVDQLVPELVETLYEEMDPTRVCVASGLCMARTLPALMSSMKNVNERLAQKITGVLMQNDPETFRKLAESVTFSDERIQNLLKGLCYVALEREHSGECVDAVSLYYPIVKTYLTTQFKSGSECEMCKLAVSYVETEVLNPSLEKDIQNELQKICLHVGSYKDECEAFIGQYFNDLWKIVVKEIKSQSLCKDIGLCPATADILVPVPRVATDECTICKDLLAEAKVELMSIEVVNAVQTFAISLCDACPVQDQCVKYVTANFASIYKSVIGKLDPQLICKSLGACSSAQSTAMNEDPRILTVSNTRNIKMSMPFALPRVHLTKQVIDNADDFLQHDVLRSKLMMPVGALNEVECTVCKYLVHYVQEELAKNDSVEYIKKELKEVCKHLPAVSNECNNFVDAYAALIAQLLSHEIDPNYVCFKLTGVCPAETKVEALPVKALKVTSCSVCQMAVDYMDHLMEDNKVDDELSELVEKVCQMMPKSTTKQCIDIVSTYGPVMLHYMGEAANSREVCQYVSLCRKVHLLGEKKCTYGPAYWCQDMAHALKCNAVEHCKSRVWGKDM